MTKNEREKVEKLCIDGMCTDGGHHKQWYLEQILKTISNKKTLEVLKQSGYEWEGVAP